VNKKIIIFVGIILVLLAGVFVFQKMTLPSNELTFDVAQKQTVTDKDVRLTFSYPGGPNGLTLFQPPVGENGLVKAYILMPTKSYEAQQSGGVPGESPASVSVFVFSLEDEVESTSTEQTDRITRLQNWAIDNTVLTSFATPKAAPEIIDLDGLKAFHYQADGLYQQDIYLASYRGLVYMFAGQYDKESDITYVAFQDLITSLSFD
jgi:hypothetical protein